LQTRADGTVTDPRSVCGRRPSTPTDYSSMIPILIFVPVLLATPTIDQPAATTELMISPSYESFLTPEPIEPAPLFDSMHDEPGPWYLRINAGGVTTTNSNGPSEDVEFDEGWLAAIAIGRRLTDGLGTVDFSVELEGVYTSQDANDNTAVDDVATIAPYLNGVFDFHLSETFSIYAGAGLGLAWMNVGTETNSLGDFSDEDGTFFTWQAKAGVKWHFSPYTAVTLGYRFRNIDDNHIDNSVDNTSFDLQTEQHVIEAGIEFGF
jgi:opacity protein-like surface antigen